MLCNTVKDPSVNPIPGRYKVDNDISQNNSESSPLTSEINFASNSAQELFIQKKTSTRLTDGFLTRVWRSLQASGDKHSRENISDEEGTELKEILTIGETLRQQANSLSASNNEAPVPQAWKGSLLKRCLVGAGLLTGTGLLGGAGYAGYKHYHARATSTENNQQPGSPYTSPEAGGSLENSFGYHALHHDYPGDRIRHTRRHLPVSAYSPTELKLNDDGQKDIFQITLKETNHRVKKMLRNIGLLPGNKPITKEKMLYEISMHLYNSENINIEYKHRIKSLAHTILSGSGIYGEQRNEILSSKQAKSIVHHWLFQNIIGTTPEKYLESKIKMDISRNYTVDDIHRLLPVDRLPVVNSLNIEELSIFEGLFVSIMWKEILLEEMPFLTFKDKRTTAIPLNHEDFSNLYSGSRFINDIKVENVTPEELISTGKAVWELAIEEGIQVGKIAYYKTPSILFYATTSPEKKEKNTMSDIDIIEHFQNHKIESIVKKDIEDKYQTYNSTMKLWFTKNELVEKIINNCPNLDLIPKNSKDIKIDLIRQAMNRITAKELYLISINKPCESAPDNLENEYHKLTTAVVDSFYDLDKYIILSAINRLPEDEMEFISSPRSIIHLADLIIDTSVMASSGFISSNRQNVNQNNVDVFIVQQEKQERIYALKEMKNILEGYKIIRIDRDINQYLLNDIIHEDFKSKCSALSSYLKNKEDPSHELCSISRKPALTESNHIKSLVDTLSDIHRTDFFNRLYEKGNDQSELQKIWVFLKGFIPFYECIEESIKHNPQAAIPACLMDVISMLPIIGETSRLAGNFGMSLVRGVLIQTATGGKAGITAVGKNILREATLPTTMELAALGKNTLITMDPGLLFIKSVVKVSKPYGKKIIDLISRNQKTSILIKNLETRISKITQATSGAQKTGILPGTELEIPVAAIGKNNNKNIYVAINSETGEKFGTKYTCLKNGILASVSSLFTTPLIRNTRSDENIHMGKPINIDDNILRVKRAGGNSNLCSELPSTSRASQTHTIMNPGSDRLLQLPGESPKNWAHRLLQLDLPIKNIAQKTGFSPSTIQRWPETKIIIQQRKELQEQTKKMAIQLMKEKKTLTYEDLKEISKKTNLSISTLSRMDEYKLKHLKAKRHLTVKDKDKIRQMLIDGYSQREISLQENVSRETIRKLKNKWRNIASKGNINTIQRTKESLLDEIRELSKTHSTVTHVSFEDESRIRYFLASAKNELNKFDQQLNTISIAMDDNKKLYTSFNSPQLEAKIKNWAATNDIHIIKPTGHAEESLFNAVPNIRHIESSHKICLDCELLLLKKSIGTTTAFSRELSRNRKFPSQYSDEIIDYGKKLNIEHDVKKIQYDEAKHLLLEGKLSLIEIEIQTGVSPNTMYRFPEHKTWQKLRPTMKVLDPRKIDVLELHQQGKSIREIATITGISKSKVHAWISQTPANLQWEDYIRDWAQSEFYSYPGLEDGSGDKDYILDLEDGSGEKHYILDLEDGSGEKDYILDSEDGSGEKDYILDLEDGSGEKHYMLT